jgi:hypothetical protein
MSSRPPLGPTSSSQVSSPGHSRSSSIRSLTGQQHAPLTPSSLHEAHTLSASPEDRRNSHGEGSGSECSPGSTPADVPEDGIEPIHDKMGTSGEDTGSQSDNHGKGVEIEVARAETSLLGRLGAGAEETARETTSLLGRPIEFVTCQVHPGPCNHGTFSLQPGSRTASIRSSDGNKSGANRSRSRGIFGCIADGLAGAGSNGKKKMSTTARLAEEHGIQTSSIMYVIYSVLMGNGQSVLDLFLCHIVAVQYRSDDFSIGTSPTISHSLPGFDNTSGHTSTAISLRLLRWPPSIYPWRSPTPRTLAMYPQSMASTLLYSIR